MNDSNKESRMTFEAVRADDELEIGDKVHKLVRLHMRDHPELDYKKAMRAIFAADQDLHREYLNTAPPVHAAVGGSHA